MEKVLVEFCGGESRKSNEAVNYMLVVIDGVELYAEIGVPAESDEEYGYDDLKAEILRQAENSILIPIYLLFGLIDKEESKMCIEFLKRVIVERLPLEYLDTTAALTDWKCVAIVAHRGSTIVIHIKEV